MLKKEKKKRKKEKKEKEKRKKGVTQKKCESINPPKQKKKHVAM
jgi:hypothetical protein